MLIQRYTIRNTDGAIKFENEPKWSTYLSGQHDTEFTDPSVTKMSIYVKMPIFLAKNKQNT